MQTVTGEIGRPTDDDIGSRTGNCQHRLDEDAVEDALIVVAAGPGGSINHVAGGDDSGIRPKAIAVGEGNRVVVAKAVQVLKAGAIGVDGEDGAIVRRAAGRGRAVKRVAGQCEGAFRIGAIGAAEIIHRIDDGGVGVGRVDESAISVAAGIGRPINRVAHHD